MSSASNALAGVVAVSSEYSWVIVAASRKFFAMATRYHSNWLGAVAAATASATPA